MVFRADVRYLEEKNEHKYVRFFWHTSCYMDYRNLDILSAKNEVQDFYN